MEKITLYHGSPDKIVVPTYSKGEEKHDYGRGFYLTERKSGQFAAQMSQMALFIGMNLIPKVLKFWIFREKAFLRGLQSL